MLKNLLTLLKKIKYELTFILKSSSEKNRYEDLKRDGRTHEDIKPEYEEMIEWV